MTKLTSSLRVYRIATALCAYLLILSSGCSLFTTNSDTDKPATTAELPAPQLPLDAVQVELQFLRMPEEQIAEIEQLWQIADEQVLPVQTRQQLEANGLRAGLVPGDMPPIFQQWIAQAQRRLREDTLEQANVASNISLVPKQLTCRAGRRKELLLRSIQDAWVPLVYQEEGQVRGETLETPEFIFGLTAIPHGDGRATLRLIPEIKHGQVRNMVVGREAAFRFDWQRQQRIFDQLAMQITMSPGQTIVLTCTEPPKGLGAHYFVTETVQRQREHVLILLRLSRTQLNELFAPEDVTAAERAAQR